MAASTMLSGCAVLLVGAGAAGGYAISRDSVKNHFDLPMSHVFQVSREVVESQGLITLEDARRGLIKAEVAGANVTVTVKSVSPRTVELKVRARNDVLLPKIEVAQAVYNKIFERLQ
jgi:hypothetical protein